MAEAALVVLAALSLGLAAYGWRGVTLRRRARQRLGRPAAPPPPRRAADVPPRPFLRRHRLLPWAAGGLLAGALWGLAGLGVALAGALGLIVALLGGQAEALLAARRSARIEAQLGDAIDLMIGSLRGGAAVLAALASATAETRPPLRPQLEEVLGRIRYGDDPQAVLRALLARVPLETFQLFTSALSVHWEVGGSLAPALANVGRTIRDRVEMARRVRALTAEARASIVAVLGVTYFIALIVWRSDPERMTAFLGTRVGQGLVTGSVVLQALGIVWAAAISRVKY